MSPRRLMPATLLGLCCVIFCPNAAWADADAQPAGESTRDLTEISLSELANIKVTSVSKRPEDLSRTAAAVHVITSDDIRSAGAQSLPYLLRLSPGVHVAQVDASQWALGIRGFTSTLARDQLALMDGRTLYSPLFAGTYWDIQQTFLEDVDRIEVVRGPGGTLWGANAMNGIVNVISKNAHDTPGGLLVLGGGTEERGFGRARYGGPLGDRGAYRVYGSFNAHDASFHPDGSDYDRWHMGQGGFRADWNLSDEETLTAQGDLYVGREGRRTTLSTLTPPFQTTVDQDARVGGGNLLGHWSRSFAGRSELDVRAYYDRTHRVEPNFAEDRDTGDLDVQYRFAPWGKQQIVAGAGYRLSSGSGVGTETIAFIPAHRTDDLVSAFLEDSVEIVPGRLQLSAGSKVEWNDYTGFELQPTARLSWSPRAHHSFWAAVTRAVRTPSRIERDLVLTASLSAQEPQFARLLGDPRFVSELEFAYEAGYRVQVSERLLVDSAVFYNRYPNLLSIETEAPFVEAGRQILPLRVGNGLTGDVSGVEIWSDTRLSPRWTIRTAYAFLSMALAPIPSSNDRTSAAATGSSPRHSLSARSTWDLPGRISADAWFRWLSDLPTQQVPATADLDLRVAWRRPEHLELALVGQHVLHSHRAEFGGGAEIERSVYAEATCRF